MPGTLTTNELVKVDDPTCCRVYVGRPIVVGDATLLRCISVTTLAARMIYRIGVLRGQGGPLSIRNGGGYGGRRRRCHLSELILRMHLGRRIWGRPVGVPVGCSDAIRGRALLCFPVRLRHCVVGRARGWWPGGHNRKSGR